MLLPKKEDPLISRKPATRRLLAGLSIAALTLTGIGVSSIPAAANDTKAMTITGFAPNSTVLTKAMRVKINKFIKKNSGYEFVTCVGFADRPGSARANSNLGKARATVGCNHVLKRDADLEIASTRGRWDDTQAGSNIRRVRIILSNSATAQLTTYFEYMGGEKGIESVSTTAGGSIVLPTPTRAGYQFLGWFTDQYNGTKVGNGGESFTPTRTRILWAQWFVPASAPVVEASSTLRIVLDKDIQGGNGTSTWQYNETIRICENPANCVEFGPGSPWGSERTLTLQGDSPSLYSPSNLVIGVSVCLFKTLWTSEPTAGDFTNLFRGDPGLVPDNFLSELRNDPPSPIQEFRTLYLSYFNPC